MLPDLSISSADGGNCSLLNTPNLRDICIPEVKIVNHSASGTESGDICIPYSLTEMDSKQNEVHNRLLRWLSSRKIKVENQDGLSRFLHLLEPNDQDSMSQQGNMIALLSTDQSDLSESTPTHVMTFDQALDILPHQWSNSSTSYVFYRDDPRCIDGRCVILQRVQLTKSCFIQAAVMLQHCLMSRSKISAQAGAIIDMKVFIRDFSRSLEPFILNQGGLVSDVFKEIVVGDPGFFLKKINEIDARWLEIYGPGVLTFRFLNETLILGSSKSLVYAGNETGQFSGRHSVIIIGVRMEGNSRHFLVRNWSPDQQVVEIREDYLNASNGKAFFVKNQNLSVREGLPWNKKKYGQI